MKENCNRNFLIPNHNICSVIRTTLNICLFFVILFFRHIPKRPGEDINKFVIELAYQLVQNQQANMVLNPFVLLATLLLQNHHQSLASGQKPGMKLQELTDRALWLRDLSRLFGACLQWPGTVYASDTLSSRSTTVTL